MKVWTLVITDSHYMEVAIFHSDEQPTAEEMFKNIDFPETDILRELLLKLRTNIKNKDKDYKVQIYKDGNKDYLFHLQCHEILTNKC